ncbi:MAG: protein phosphatase 2C domain-containing protein [Actinomycetota bacterium]
MSVVDAQTDWVRVMWGAASDIGVKRALNEDRYLAQSPVFVVADGMGGHEAGELASAEAVDALAVLVGLRAVTGRQVQGCMSVAQDRIRAIETVPGRGAGTTLTGVVISEQDGIPYWLVLNLGDSRTYRMADGEFRQISVDHSEVQEMIEEGVLTVSEASHHPRRHVVTKALGVGSEHEADFWMIPIAGHDRILVCSDGLTGEVGDERISQILLAETCPQSAADLLVEVALAAGGRDNITVLVVDAWGVPGSEDAETAPRLQDEADTEDTVPRVHVGEAERC